jgi:capsular exopolysaccharide synthesis family protein
MTISSANKKNVATLSLNIKGLFTRYSSELSTIEGNLLAQSKNKEIKTIYITSCFAREGKTISALSMAYALSCKANFRVLLVDGNLHSPKIREFFNVDNKYGLSDIIVSDLDYNTAIIETEFKNLMIMTHGNEALDTIEAFREGKFEEMLYALKKEFDYVVFDGYHVFGSSDVSVIAKYFDGLVFVVECEKTKWDMLQEAKEKIEMVGGNILGVVLNKRKHYIPKALYGKI